MNRSDNYEIVRRAYLIDPCGTVLHVLVDKCNMTFITGYGWCSLLDDTNYKHIFLPDNIEKPNWYGMSYWHLWRDSAWSWCHMNGIKNYQPVRVHKNPDGKRVISFY